LSDSKLTAFRDALRNPQDEPSDTIKEFQEALSKKAFADKNDYKHYDQMYVHLDVKAPWRTFRIHSLVQRDLTFPLDVIRDRHHGWAAARANLDDPENKKAFEDVYGRLATFFGSNNQ
jgi:dienelactone hydrolase